MNKYKMIAMCSVSIVCILILSLILPLTSDANDKESLEINMHYSNSTITTKITVNSDIYTGVVCKYIELDDVLTEEDLPAKTQSEGATVNLDQTSEDIYEATIENVSKRYVVVYVSIGNCELCDYIDCKPSASQENNNSETNQESNSQVNENNNEVPTTTEQNNNEEDNNSVTSENTSENEETTPVTTEENNALQTNNETPVTNNETQPENNTIVETVSNGQSNEFETIEEIQNTPTTSTENNTTTNTTPATIEENNNAVDTTPTTIEENSTTANNTTVTIEESNNVANTAQTNNTQINYIPVSAGQTGTTESEFQEIESVEKISTADSEMPKTGENDEIKIMGIVIFSIIAIVSFYKYKTEK